MSLEFTTKAPNKNDASFYRKVEGNFADLNPVFEKELLGSDPSDLDRYTIEFFTYNKICKCAFFAEFNTAGTLITGLTIDFPQIFLSLTAEHPLQPTVYVDGTPSVITSPESMISQPQIAYFKDDVDKEHIGYSGLYAVSGSLKFIMRSSVSINAKRFQAGFEWQQNIYLYTS